MRIKQSNVFISDSFNSFTTVDCFKLKAFAHGKVNDAKTRIFFLWKGRKHCKKTLQGGITCKACYPYFNIK